jgi:hypothetical protein
MAGPLRLAGGDSVRPTSTIHLHLDGRSFELAAAPHVADSLCLSDLSF